MGDLNDSDYRTQAEADRADFWAGIRARLGKGVRLAFLLGFLFVLFATYCAGVAEGLGTRCRFPGVQVH